MKLRPHQQRIVDSNPDKALLCWEMRTGKSLPAKLWLEKRGGNSIIVCPKALVQDWKDLAPFARVFSKENFKKEWKTIKNPKALVVDEAHTFGSALFTRQRSQLATAMYKFIGENQSMGVLLLSATPIRNDPSSLHTLLCYMGIQIPWKKYRDHFYELKSMPYLLFPAWLPKGDWRHKARRLLEKYADVVSLKDCVDFLPPLTTEVIRIKTPKYIRPMDVIYNWRDEHRHEQTKKLEYVKALGFKKIILVANYTAQIEELAKELSKEREVFVLDGRTKKPQETIRQAQESDACYLICQSAMGTGWNGWMFGAMVFVSMDHTALNHTQMLGRTTSVDNPQPRFVQYLIGGRWDRRIYESIMLNNNFNPHKYGDAPAA
jgi:superfamily II DNA or RNA helicase